MFVFRFLDGFLFGLIQSLLREKIWRKKNCEICLVYLKIKSRKEQKLFNNETDAEFWTEWIGLNQNVHIGLKLIGKNCNNFFSRLKRMNILFRFANCKILNERKNNQKIKGVLYILFIRVPMLQIAKSERGQLGEWIVSSWNIYIHISSQKMIKLWILLLWN